MDPKAAAQVAGSDAAEASERAPMPQPQAPATEAAAAVQAQAAEGAEAAASTLFVGDLSRSITEEDLLRAFSAFGDVVEASIKRDRFSQRNLGYGFVQMASRAQAEEALKHMNGTELAGRQIRVNWAQRTARLFAGGLPSMVTVEQLLELFGRFGPLSEDDIILKDAKNGSGKFAFIKFQERQHAEEARRQLQNGSDVFPSMRIDWHHGNTNAQHQHYTRQRDPLPSSVMLSDYSVYIHFEVDDPSVEVTEELLRTTFSRFGPVSTTAVKAKHVSEETGKVKGYGFVHFAGTAHGRQAATTAVQTVTGIVMDGVRYQADFSNSTKRQAAGVLTAQQAGVHPVAAAGLQMEYMMPGYDATTGMVFPSFQMYSTVASAPAAAAPIDAGHGTPSPAFPLPIAYYPYLHDQLHAAHSLAYLQAHRSPEQYGGRGGRGNRMARDQFRPPLDGAPGRAYP